MQYFTETAYTHTEALKNLKMKYGDRAKVLTHRSVRLGGFMGLFTREGVELTGYISQDLRSGGVKDLEEEKKKILSTVKSDQTIQLVLKEVQEIKQRMASEVPVDHEQHKTIARIEDLLIRNDFSVRYTREILSRIKREFSLEALDNYDEVQDRVVDWIGEGIRLYNESFAVTPKIVVLVGPTGVGKTTTVAKLAAIHGISGNGVRPKSVRMITIDNYRIGARQQIETYGDIMNIPVACVETFHDLKKQLALYQDVDLILIDTIGKSPKDYMKLAEMRELLDACGSGVQMYLTVSATTKTADLLEILQQFEPFKYEALVVTKLDETMHIGSLVSALWERNRPIAYITDGQVVPQDISRACVTDLLMHLDGFRVNQEAVSAAFDRKSGAATAGR
ncbi:MAG: flagellar biosynthesis protein FlhF [Spirochaetales bacterium]|nr:flagellar biosynthesis protein FlhF [Spirochaetales bacterium]